MNQDIITNHPDAQSPTPINRERTSGAASASKRSSSIDNPTPSNRERRERIPPSEAQEIPSNRERREPGPIPPSTGPTGPRTPNGKLRSSLNAIKHGLRAAKPENAVPDQMRRTYELLRARYLDEYRPSGPTESTLLDMVILAAWQLYRIREMELFAPIELASPLDNSSFGKSDRLARYRASYERMFQSNLYQLKQIQQERLLLAAERECILPANIPPGVRLQPLFKRLEEIKWRPKARAAVDALFEREQSAIVKNPDNGYSPSVRL